MRQTLLLFVIGWHFYTLCKHLIDLLWACEMMYGPVHEISNNVVCATSKALDQPAHMRSLIRAFACRMHIL